MLLSAANCIIRWGWVTSDGGGLAGAALGASSWRIGVHGNTSGSFLPLYWIGDDASEEDFAENVDKSSPRRSLRNPHGKKTTTRVCDDGADRSVTRNDQQHNGMNTNNMK